MEPRHARAVLGVVFVATVLVGLNATMLAVALPAVVEDLGASSVEGSWMLLAYLLVNGSCLVLAGQLSDSLDLRRVFLAGVVLFGVAGGALAVTRDPPTFIAARALQGAGAAMLLSTAAAMVSVAFPAERRRSAMGVYLAGFAIAQVSGPLVGGTMTAALGWRWIFVLGVMVASAATALGWEPLRQLPRRPRGRLRVDIPGNLLIVAVTTLLLVALSGVQQVGWRDARSVVPLVVAALLLPVFVAVERRSRWPAIAVDLLRHRVFATANLAGMALAVPRIVPGILLSLWFQGYAGYGPTRAALTITPLAGAVAVGTLVAGRVTTRAGDWFVARWSSLGAVLGAVLLLVALRRDAELPTLVVGLVVTGLCTGAFSTVNSTMIMGLRPLTQAGTVNGIRTMAQTLGLSLGTALLLSLATAALTGPDAAGFFAGQAPSLDDSARAAVHIGYVVAGAVLVALCGLAAAATWASGSRAVQGMDHDEEPHADPL